MKQQKRNKILVGSLISLLLMALVLFLYQRKGEGVDKNIFKIADLASIDNVIMASPSGSVELSYNGTRWKVNNEFDADDQLVTVLFATLQQVEAKRFVAKSISDSLTKVIRSHGVKVLLLDGDKKVKEMYVGGNMAKTEAYFLDENTGPIIMTIPGYRVYVSGVFEVDQRGWRDKRIFNFSWRNFKKLKTQLYQQSDQNFEIEDQGDGFDLVNTMGTDTARLNNYLDEVSLLLAREFIPAGYNRKYDSLLRTTPDITIEVLDLGDNIYRLDLYRPIKGDPDVLGKINGKDAVIFSRDQILPILRPRDYFLRQRP